MAKLQTGTRIFGTANIDSMLVVGNISPQSPSLSSNSGTLQVGSGLTFSDTGIVASFTSNTNSYSQIINQNSNTGTLSSSDFIVNNDSAAQGTSIYGDFGINSTTFNNPNDLVFGDASGTYLFSAGGSLAQGTLNAFDYKLATNNIVRLTANGTTGDITVANSLSVSGNITAPSAIINGLNVYNYITSSFAQANNAVANLGPVITVNSAGFLLVSNTLTSTSTGTGALRVSGGAGIAGNVYIGGTANLAAGTTTTHPIGLTTGLLLTTQKTGVIEYDGAAAYFTPDTTIGRGFIPSTSTFRLLVAGNAITGTQANFFGTTSNIPLVANAFYEIDIYALGLKGSTAGAVTWQFTNSAAPTLMVVDYEQSPLSGIAAPPGSVTALTNINFRGTTTTTSATYNFATGSLAASVTHYFRFKLLLRNGAGTSLQIRLTAGNGNASVTPQAGSVWFARRLPDANTGTFAA